MTGDWIRSEFTGVQLSVSGPQELISLVEQGTLPDMVRRAKLRVQEMRDSGEYDTIIEVSLRVGDGPWEDLTFEQFAQRVHDYRFIDGSNVPA